MDTSPTDAVDTTDDTADCDTPRLRATLTEPTVFDTPTRAYTTRSGVPAKAYKVTFDNVAELAVELDGDAEWRRPGGYTPLFPPDTLTIDVGDEARLTAHVGQVIVVLGGHTVVLDSDVFDALFERAGQ